MNSLEWRAKKLEDRLLGGANVIHNTDFGSSPSICKQLQQVSEQYKSFLEAGADRFVRFKKLYERHKELLAEVDAPQARASDTVKSKLVLAYEDDLIKHLESLKSMSEKADKVLDSKAWPDLSQYRERLNKLETITHDQHLQALGIDKRTEELIEIYNDIINSLKRNTVIWNQKLEVYEDEERQIDDDE